MSHEVNDKLHDAIIDEIVDGLDNLDEKWWGIYSDVASEYDTIQTMTTRRLYR